MTQTESYVVVAAFAPPKQIPDQIRTPECSRVINKNVQRHWMRHGTQIVVTRDGNADAWWLLRKKDVVRDFRSEESLRIIEFIVRNESHEIFGCRFENY